MVPSGGMSAESGSRRFRVGEVPPPAEGFTHRPDTARGVTEALVPGASVALVPGSAFAEGPQNWLGACGKTQIAVLIAESLWRSGDILQNAAIVGVYTMVVAALMSVLERFDAEPWTVLT